MIDRAGTTGSKVLPKCYSECMSDPEIIDDSPVRFSSTVFPSEEDMALWNALTPAQQRAVILDKVAKGLSGPPASSASKAEIMAEVLAEMKHDL